MKKTIGRGLVILAILILVIGIAPPSFAAYIDSLAGYWKMDSTWLDETANHNDGQAHNGATFNTSNQKFGSGAGSFDGSDDYVDVGNAASLDITKELTVSVWYKHLGGCGIVDKNRVSSYSMHLSTGVRFGSQAFGNPSIGVWADSTTTMQVGQWYYLVGTYSYSANELKIYVNGVLENTQNPGGSGFGSNTNSVFIGSTSDGLRINGLIDDVAIWSRTLSPTEVSTLYSSGQSLGGLLDAEAAPEPATVAGILMMVLGIVARKVRKLSLRGANKVSDEAIPKVASESEAI